MSIIESELGICSGCFSYLPSIEEKYVFHLEIRQIEAMDLLKLAFITPFALVLLNYSEEAGEIVLEVDTSLEKWGRVLMQLV